MACNNIILLAVYILYVGSVDPLIEIVLMPERRFKIKAVKTDFKSKEANPFYGKDFKMYVHFMMVWCVAIILSYNTLRICT